MQVNPATGACTKGTNLYFNGPSGRGSTPSRAVAFSNNIAPSTQSDEYILSGVCSFFSLFLFYFDYYNYLIRF